MRPPPKRDPAKCTGQALPAFPRLRLVPSARNTDWKSRPKSGAVWKTARTKALKAPLEMRIGTSNADFSKEAIPPELKYTSSGPPRSASAPSWHNNLALWASTCVHSTFKSSRSAFPGSPGDNASPFACKIEMMNCSCSLHPYTCE